INKKFRLGENITLVLPIITTLLNQPFEIEISRKSIEIRNISKISSFLLRHSILMGAQNRTFNFGTALFVIVWLTPITHKNPKNFSNTKIKNNPIMLSYAITENLFIM